jgi:hypothetical protein
MGRAGGIRLRYGKNDLHGSPGFKGGSTAWRWSDPKQNRGLAWFRRALVKLEQPSRQASWARVGRPQPIQAPNIRPSYPLTPTLGTLIEEQDGASRYV